MYTYKYKYMIPIILLLSLYCISETIVCVDWALQIAQEPYIISYQMVSCVPLLCTNVQLRDSFYLIYNENSAEFYCGACAQSRFTVVFDELVIQNNKLIVAWFIYVNDAKKGNLKGVKGKRR